MTIALIVLGVAVVAAGAGLMLTGAAAGVGDNWGFGHMGGYRGYAYGLRPFARGHFGFPWVPIAGLAIVFAVLARAGRRHHHFPMHGGSGRGCGAGDESAIEVLRREFAEGRMSTEDFIARKKVLEEDGAGSGKEEPK
ncbi:MAG TPA: hypothetical protein DIC34_16760 [Treponema sp.]|nr:MAG: hypothetical protein A2001_18930 [Treponema sp. GWC1_61_84]OHE70433.1 MAG: hypothetical protein A2413_18205 [Treponema sp. RIFOXYC1_FULL_61_9]HCM28158.1 hypothetical protein [Treponema sp.]